MLLRPAHAEQQPPTRRQAKAQLVARPREVDTLNI